LVDKLTAMATIRDIAAKAGLSKSAVSLALRQSSRIPEATRAHVLAVAQAMGYRPNPVFAHMMRSVRSTGPLRSRSTIGILHGFTEPQPSHSIPYHAEWVAGARERAEGLGYVVDELWLQQPGMSARRFSEIIRARGINSLLIAPLPERRSVQLDWAGFSAVTAGYSLIDPRLSRVVPNHQQVMIECLRQLMMRGYRRVGLALDTRLDPLARFNLMAPFLWFQSRRRPGSMTAPVLELANGQRAQFLRWLKRNKLEAVIVTSRLFCDWIRAEKLAVPEALGVVCTSRTVALPGYCCVNQQPHKLGAAAVDMLIAQVNRGEFGLPSNPKTVFTDVMWTEGTSLRQVGPAIAQPSFDFL
jgi:LacI family transcriptional regulator